MKHLLALVAALTLWTPLASLVQPTPAAASATTRPNIVYFLVDDMGYADVGLNGCKDIHTPNIDAIAKKGAADPLSHQSPMNVCASL